MEYTGGTARNTTLESSENLTEHRVAAHTTHCPYFTNHLQSNSVKSPHSPGATATTISGKTKPRNTEQKERPTVGVPQRPIKWLLSLLIESSANHSYCGKHPFASKTVPHRRVHY